ncbi:hypothetical protein VTN49DRAFT_426 [Thermomyces lanuginosus]|uniref:uncharacterized protein n=1 Tax=Thermomyces lanuginosus TaxID=5541 RepID=UPI003742251C
MSDVSREPSPSQLSVGSQHSDETLHGEEEKDQGEPVQQQPARPRVRFRSLVEQQSAESDHPTWIDQQKSQHRDYPRPPFARPPPPRRDDPSYASEDITNASVNDRATGGAADARQEERQDQPQQKSDNKKRFRKFNSIRERARAIATRLGREEHEGDGLTSTVRDSDWAGDGGVPLSDFTDNHHKTDEDRRRDQSEATSEAHRLVRELTQHRKGRRRRPRPRQPSDSGRQTPVDSDPETLEARVRSAGGGGILSNLLKLYGSTMNQSTGNLGQDPGTPTSEPESGRSTPGWATPQSGASTPRKPEKLKWYKKNQNQSVGSLVGAANNLGASASPRHTSEMLSSAAKRRKQYGKPRLEDEIRVTVHIAEIISRQRYLMQLCRALMKFGAPTHRLEEYMQMTARVLEVDAQFLYLPGCMIMSFDDPSTRTTEVKLVRMGQGVDLGRLADTHRVYKNVVHDLIGVDEATQELQEIMNRRPKHPVWFLVFMYGVASATVGPFAFGARPIDMPISFLLGCMLGFMQLVLAKRSTLYSNVFEVFASVVTSFLARAFGSIRWGIKDGKQQYLFCFSSIAQSAIALILPGFLVLCSSLELQSHQIIAGSIRMVYAIIYSLFLGYGITVGTTIYGLMDAKANSNTECPPSPISSPYLQRFPFVILMACWLVIINQGKLKQGPVMVAIAFIGYVVNYICTRRLGSNSEVANTLGAFTIGVLGNLYSRLWHGHAATAILPGIFVLVPSGLAATGSLVSGVASADQIRGNVTGAHNETASGSPGTDQKGFAGDTSVFNLGFGMIQVAIGITVGLFLAALVVYPYGKRRSGLFSF